MKKRGCFSYSKSAQIWVETVIYTLIALTLIGAVLAFIVPRIQQVQDKAVIDQSISLMEDLNAKVSSIAGNSAGNKRVINLNLKKGSINISGTSDKVIFQIDSGYDYSEEGLDVKVGNVVARTDKKGSLNTITLTDNFTAYDIQYQKNNEDKILSQSSTPYNLIVENSGTDEFGKTIINFDIS